MAGSATPNSRRSLRLRVAIILALFGGAVSVVLAMALYVFSHDLEERLIDDTLTAELEDYIARRQRNPHSLPEKTATIRAYVVAREGGTEAVPAEVAALGPGRHRLSLEGAPFRAQVRLVGEQRFAVLYNESALERRERGLLGLLTASVLIMTLVSAVLGQWLAGRAIAPLMGLVQRVSGLRPEDHPGPLAEEFPWDEVHELAADFDGYLGRLHAFIERERLFTGDVSHELRTPLAVINGASELLLADGEVTGRNRERAERIARAAAEMSEITGVLLALAREEGAEGAAPPVCAVEPVVREVVDRQRELFRSKALEVEMVVEASPSVGAERAVVAMVVANLVRNAFAFTAEGRVRVLLHAGGVRVEDSGVGIASGPAEELFKPYVRGGESSGAGLGLSLVRRLCARHGWRATLENHPAGGAVAELLFSPQGEVPPPDDGA